MRYLLGIDLGTSGAKTALFDEAGDTVAACTQEYPLLQPKNGWAEQAPGDWWQAVVKGIREVLASGKANGQDIAGIGLSGQMHGLVMLDGKGRVIRPAILWCDGRTEKQCKMITQAVGAERLIQLTGNPALAGFTAGKILWVRENEPEHYARCRQVLLPKDYIRFCLTGKYATDVTDASGTNLMDVRRREWSGEVLRALDLDEALLPPIYESCQIAGCVTQEAAEVTGLIEGTPVVAGAGDNACAAVGTGVVTPERAFTTIGTSGVVYAHSRDFHVDAEGRIHTFCAPVPGEYAVMSCTLAAGLSLRWFKDTLCGEEAKDAARQKTNVYKILDQQAQAVPAGARELLFLPYLMGERSPLLNEKSRGVFFGLSAIHTKKDMLRSVMEGVVYSQRACFEIMVDMGVIPDKMIVCGGGGSSALWRQMLADNYGRPIWQVDGQEGPAKGAALLAGTGVQIYRSVPDACKQTVHDHLKATPNISEGKKYEKYYMLYRSLYPALKSSFDSLAKLREHAAEKS